MALYHPELKGWSLGLMGGPDSQNKTAYHPERRGCNLRLEPWTDLNQNSRFYHPELRA